MKHGYQMVRDSVKNCPLPLSDLPLKLRSYADSLLPYSTGIEIECSNKEDIRSYKMMDIFIREVPNLICCDIDANEKRFRIPSGIKGMIALYQICDLLKEYCEFNPLSGIHYHVDFTDISLDNFIKLNRVHSGKLSWILKALKSWNYTGEFNDWMVSRLKTAVRFHYEYQTLEFRIGEMTFDYELMIKRILHCQNISKSLKSSLKSAHPNKKGETKVADFPRIIGRIEL